MHPSTGCGEIAVTHTLACALYCNSDGTLNGAGTFVAWLLGIPFGIALLIGAVRLLTGNYGKPRRRW